MARRKTLSDLLDPSHSLSGRELWRLDKAISRIETQPLINAYRRQASRYRRDMRRDMGGYERLRKTTNRQTKGIYKGLDQQMAAAQRATRQSGQALQNQINQTSQAANAQLGQIQGSVLGQQMDILAGQNIDAGQSQSGAAIAQAMARQQVDQSGVGQDWAGLAGLTSNAAVGTVRNQRNANRSARAQALTNINTSIASRKGQARADYGEARREVLGKLADQKALIGPTRLKNLMDLRESERKYRNERLAIMQDRAQANADNALDRAKLNEDIRHNKAGEANDSSGGGSGGSSGGDTTYRDFFAAANTIRKDAVGKGNPITPDGDFFDQVASSEGVSLTPRQRAAWSRRYRRWLRQHGLLG